MIEKYDAYECHGPYMIAEYNLQLKGAMEISVCDYSCTYSCTASKITPNGFLCCSQSLWLKNMMHINAMVLPRLLNMIVNWKVQWHSLYVNTHGHTAAQQVKLLQTGFCVVGNHHDWWIWCISMPWPLHDCSIWFLTERWKVNRILHLTLISFLVLYFGSEQRPSSWDCLSKVCLLYVFWSNCSGFGASSFCSRLAMESFNEELVS